MYSEGLEREGGSLVLVEVDSLLASEAGRGWAGLEIEGVWSELEFKGLDDESAWFEIGGTGAEGEGLNTLEQSGRKSE